MVVANSETQQLAIAQLEQPKYLSLGLLNSDTQARIDVALAHDSETSQLIAIPDFIFNLVP